LNTLDELLSSVLAIPTLREQKNIMDIQKTIPHRPPFLFVDNVISCDEAHIVAERTWRPEEEFYKGHYPDNPITPGVLLCESVFQTAALLMSERLRTDPGAAAGTRVPILARIGNTRFRHMVRPGQKGVISVSLKESLNGFHFLSGKVTVDNKTALTIEFTLTLADEASVD
jgi:3-hydroxyacyl-[acyl-carrier-protein] dehydratase